MPTYEFACEPCFKRGVVSQWEMTFKVDDPKNSFCPACGSKGKQVILTPPMIMGKDGSRERHQAADKMLETEFKNRGITTVKQRDPREHYERMAADLEREVRGGGKAPETFGDPKTTGDFRPRWGSAQDVLAAASGGTAAARQDGAKTGTDIIGGLSRVLPSETIVHPEDAKKGRVPVKNAHRVS